MQTKLKMDQEHYDYGEDEQPIKVSDAAVNDHNYQERYARAKKRVVEMREFYSHFLVYICVNVVVYIVDIITGGGIEFAYWVTLGWGIGVVAHFFSVFGESMFLGHDWEERKIRELMDQDEKPKRRG